MADPLAIPSAGRAAVVALIDVGDPSAPTSISATTPAWPSSATPSA